MFSTRSNRSADGVGTEAITTTRHIKDSLHGVDLDSWKMAQARLLQVLASTTNAGALDELSPEKLKAAQERMQDMLGSASTLGDMGFKYLMNETEKATEQSARFGDIKSALTWQQAAVNIFVGNDNFIRDSIAGK